MTKKEIIETLNQIYKDLDKLQETDLAQADDEIMWELGEAMGSLDNAIDILKN